MSQPPVSQISFAKVTLVLSITLIVSFGLCGIGMAASDGGNRPGAAGFLFGGMMTIGLVGFWGSILGLVVTFLVWVITSIVRAIRR